MQEELVTVLFVLVLLVAWVLRGLGMDLMVCTTALGFGGHGIGGLGSREVCKTDGQRHLNHTCRSWPVHGMAKHSPVQGTCLCCMHAQWALLLVMVCHFAAQHPARAVLACRRGYSLLLHTHHRVQSQSRSV